uniref:Inositol-pentakisphosphate 2-kinase n=1 Tax=Equus caballus TaxID=9796 RepID=A0A9L0RHR9_HORSE
MKEFLGENYVHCGEVVQLPLDFVKQLCLKVQSERPESRCDKDLDTLSGYALCLPNLARLQTYHFAEHRPILCVEIKPKCGFIPFSSDVTHEMKHKVCRYCMHQHLKVATGKWKQISKYCPLDLYSGNKQRMHFALKSLLQEAQNNLKIFKVQMLDLLDIEGLYPLYRRVERYLEEFPEERKTLQIDGPYDEAFYQKLLDLSTEDDGTVAFALTKVQQYRVAMTAKDCSIMIALSPCLQDTRSDQRPIVPSSRSRFTFSVSVLDLDLKPYESIPHQYKLDGKIVNYYSKTLHAKDAAVMPTRFKESEDCTLVLHKV